MHCCDRDEDLAAEVLQEAYARVARGTARFAGRSSLQTWFFGVLRLTARELARRRRRRLLPLPPAEETADPLTDPVARLAAAEEVNRLNQALRRLSHRQQDILHLVFYQECTVDQAAGILGVTPGTARQHYHRGKQALRDLLNDRASEDSHGR